MRKPIAVKQRGSTVASAATKPEPINDSEPEVSRVGFAVGPDKRPVEPDRLRSNTKEALRIAYSDEAFLKAIGVRTESDSENDQLLTIISHASYDILSVLAIVGARRAGYTKEQAALLAFDAREKQMLAGPTSRVIKKYIPNIGGQYRDEIMLAIALSNVIMQKIVLLRESAKVPPNGSTVAPESTQQSEVTM